MDEPKLAITCNDGDRCNVYFEPWGNHHVLERHDVFTVRSRAVSRGRVSVSFVEDGISVLIGSEDPVVVTNKAGEELVL